MRLSYMNSLKRRIERLEKAPAFWPVWPKLSEVSDALDLMEFGRQQVPWLKNDWLLVEEVVGQAEGELLRAYMAIGREEQLRAAFTNYAEFDRALLQLAARRRPFRHSVEYEMAALILEYRKGHGAPDVPVGWMPPAGWRLPARWRDPDDLLFDDGAAQEADANHPISNGDISPAPEATP